MATAMPVDKLRPGDHACLTFTDLEERRDIVAAFVRAGIARGEKVISYTVTARGPMERRIEQLWGVRPDAKVMAQRLGDELRQAEREGYPGLRITTDMCWAARPQAGAEQLLAFEQELATLPGKLTAICEYHRESFDPVTLGYAARVHQRTVAASVYHEDPVLRICRQHLPPGVRVAGELDYTRSRVLADAIAEAVRLDHDVHLNLSRLRFLDAGAAEVILHAAASLPKGRRMVLTCTSTIGRTLTVAGAKQVPALRLLVRRSEG